MFPIPSRIVIRRRRVRKRRKTPGTHPCHRRNELCRGLETFNVLKTNGYNFEHNFGHGRQTLASVPVVLNLLAFAIHTANDLMEDAWRKARRALGTRMRLFEHLRTVTACHVFPSWAILMTTLVTGRPPPATA